jgi:hypothetical protein
MFFHAFTRVSEVRVLPPKEFRHLIEKFEDGTNRFNSLFKKILLPAVILFGSPLSSGDFNLNPDAKVYTFFHICDTFSETQKRSEEIALSFKKF